MVLDGSEARSTIEARPGLGSGGYIIEGEKARVRGARDVDRGALGQLRELRFAVSG